MVPAISNSASVYVLLGDGKSVTCVARNMDRTKLVEMSPKAAALLRNGGSKIPGAAGPNNVVLFTPEVNPDAAIKVCRWIERYDKTKPPETQILGVKHINPQDSDYTIMDLVKLYHTAYAFMIPKIYRGDELRDGIYEYIHMAALSLNEFIMMHECLSFDTGMLKTAQHHCMWLKVSGTPPQELDAIEKYAKESGFWEEMEKAEKTLREQNARDQAREERRKAAAEAARIRAHQKKNRGMGGA